MSRRRASNNEKVDQSDLPAGSPPSGEPAFLVIGRLRRTHGIHGEILMEVLTDFPERLRIGKSVFLGSDHLPLRIRSVRNQDKALLLAFEGILDAEEAGQLRNQLLYVSAKDLPPLPEGEYYHHQLVGLHVLNESGQVLGDLTQILETGANDVYVVHPADGAEILLPAIEDVILGVDLERGEMIVRPPEWW